MKNKKWLIAACCVLALAFVLGVTGVVRFPAGSGVSTPDRLIGILVTREYLDTFDSEKYFDENIGKLVSGGGISEADQQRYGRLWAVRTEKTAPSDDGTHLFTETDFVFEGVDGLRLIYPALHQTEGSYGCTNADTGICDVSINVDATGTGEKVKLEGSVYYVPGKEDVQFFFNPVYQTENGDVYALPGESMSMDPDQPAGASMGFSLSGFQNASEGGKETASSGTEVTVSIRTVHETLKVRALQFSADHRLLKTDEFLPGELPETFAPLPETEYIIRETVVNSEDPDDSAERTLIPKQETFLSAMSCREDGICIPQYCEILWPGSSGT